MTTITINVDEKDVQVGILKKYLEKNLKNIIFQMELEKDINKVKQAQKSDFVNL